MDNNQENKAQIPKETKNFDISKIPLTDSLNLLKKDKNMNSLETWQSIVEKIDSKENKDLGKRLKTIIEENDESSYEEDFNYQKNNPFYNVYLIYSTYSFLKTKKDKKKYIYEKFISNKIWKDYLSDFLDKKFYYSKITELNQLIGKNYFLIYFIEINKILIDDNEIKSDEKIYNKIVSQLFSCLLNVIKESVSIENDLKNLKIMKNLNKSRLKFTLNINNKPNLNLEGLVESYKIIFNLIFEIIINNDNIFKIFIEKEKEKFEIIFYEGIIRNSFTDISQLISQFLINIFKKFKNIKEKDENIDNINLTKFFFYIYELIFYNLQTKVHEQLKEIPIETTDDNLIEKNYCKNIEIFFNTIEDLLNYMYIYNYNGNHDKLKTLIEKINKNLIPFLYNTDLKKIIPIKDYQDYYDYYELLYGGLCRVLFILIKEINSSKKKKNNNFENIELNLSDKKNDLASFLFNEILFYQCIKNNENSLFSNIDIDRFKINSKYTSDNINDLFLLLTVIDFNNKEKHQKKSTEEKIDYYLFKLNDIYKSNYWISDNISSWRLNHKDKIKTNKYTGLKNFGNTCYMNTLIQILFNIGLFRDSLMQCEYTDTNKNIIYEMRQLLFSLQYLLGIQQYYTPRSFQQNFEGGPLNPREQMDIDEFFSILMDKIENRLKGTKNENLIKYIFQGKQNDNINFECKHKRTNESKFYSIQLQVKDKKNIYESLDTFIEGEKMDGDNCIICEKCNKKVPSVKNQDFQTLPRILMFVLKRFEFDYIKMTRYKINDYFEFPLELDMNKYTDDYISGKNKDMNNKYILRGIAIHSGSCEMGHYYAINRNIDSKNEDWFLYNDSIVTKFDIDDLKEEAFGDKIEEKIDNNQNNQNIDNANNINTNKNNNINKDKNTNNDKKVLRNIDNNTINLEINENKNNGKEEDKKYKDTDISFNEDKKEIYKNPNQNNTNNQRNANNQNDNNKNNNVNINKNKPITKPQKDDDFSLFKYSYTNLFKKSGKSAYLLFYEKVNKSNCEKFDKIEAIKPSTAPKNINPKLITQSNIVYKEKFDFLKNMKSPDNMQILKSLNEDMNNYFLLKKLLSSEYHQFLITLYINLLNYYLNNKLTTRIKYECGTPFKYCLKSKDNIYCDNDYFYKREEKANYSNLYNYLENKKIFFFSLDNIEIVDEKKNEDKIKTIFKDLIQFFFNIKIRTINKKCFGEYVDLIKFFINNFPYCCEYFLEEFCIYNVLVEYLINCPLYDIKKLIVGLINCAMINYMEYWKKKLENDEQKKISDYQKEKEVKQILAGTGSQNKNKHNNLNFYDVIDPKNEDKTNITNKKEEKKENKKEDKKKENKNEEKKGHKRKESKNKDKKTDKKNENKNEEKKTKENDSKIKETTNRKTENPKAKKFQELSDIKTIMTVNENLNTNGKIDEKKDSEKKNNEKENIPKVMVYFINNIISLINEINFDNNSDNKFLFYVLYKFSIISPKTRDYLIKVIPLLDFMNIKLNTNLSSGKTCPDIKKPFDYGYKHQRLNIINNKEKIKMINEKGGLYHYENYKYLLYFNLLTYENKDEIFSFDNKNFIFKLITEIINKQDCFVFAHLLNIKCLNNMNRENLIIDVIIDVLGKLDYKEDINYKFNKASKNTEITDIENYKNTYELDPRNILLILKLFILHKDSNGEVYKNRIEIALQKIFKLFEKYSKYYNYSILLIDFIIDLFLYNKILIKEFVKPFNDDLKNILKWIEKHKISPLLYKIDGLFMYRDDNVAYQNNINEKQKKEFDEKEIKLSNERISKLNDIINKKVNEKDYSFDSDIINISEFTFINEDKILFDGKRAVVRKHLNEMIKIEFENGILFKEIKNENELNNDNVEKNHEDNENKIITKMWVEIENEKLKITKLFK